MIVMMASGLVCLIRMTCQHCRARLDLEIHFRYIQYPDQAAASHELTRRLITMAVVDLVAETHCRLTEAADAVCYVGMMVLSLHLYVLPFVCVFTGQRARPAV